MKIKYTIYSIIIFLTSGIYFFLAYKGFSSQSMDINTVDKFTGTIAERGLGSRKSGKLPLEIFYLKIEGLSQPLGVYRKNGDYSFLMQEIKPGDTVTAYYLGTSGDEKINIDLVQLEGRTNNRTSG